MARKGLRRLPPFKDYLFRSICLLALVIVAVGFLLAHNEPAHTSKARTEAAQAAENHPSPEGFWAKLTDDPTAFFTMVLAGLTFVLAGTASAQIFFLISADRTTRLAARAAIRSANVATRTVSSIETTAERQLRAYVGIERAYLDNADPDRPINAVLVIKNGGQTPAYKQRSAVTVTPFVVDAEQVNILATDSSANVTLMPGSTNEVRFNDINTALIAEKSKLAFLINGQIIYEDVFGKSRYTNVRMVAPPGKIVFQFLADGNDAA